MDAMPLAASASDILILEYEYIAGNRRIPHAVFAPILASLSSPSATSQRLRQTLVLRALDAALHTEDGAACASSVLLDKARKVLADLDAALQTEDGAACASRVLLDKARKVLADPDAAACFPRQISFAGNEQDNEARAAAAVADLKRLLDLEWDSLPPSRLELELANDRIAGDGAHQTWAAADHTKRTMRRLFVGESTGRDISMQDGSAPHQLILTEVADNSSNANEADGNGRDDVAHSSNENREADRGQDGMAGRQNAWFKGAEGQVSEKSVASTKCSLMKRNHNASTNEWDISDDDQPVRKRRIYPSEGNSYYMIRKKWSEIEEKTLLEGVEKYGKGNWKDIKLAYPDVFEERSTVDLKDKFRNLERRHHESA